LKSTESPSETPRSWDGSETEKLIVIAIIRPGMSSWLIITSALATSTSFTTPRVGTASLVDPARA
jgi:hypothetical protein